jgi:lipoyl(octanoyl) transferase
MYFNSMKVFHIDLGLTDFNEVWQLQKNILAHKQKNSSADILITNSHHHVYTLGKAGDKNHLLLSENELKAGSIAYYEIDRGGDLTYHGPGQLVVYPIFDLNNYYPDSHRFLRDLEEVIIRTLKEYGIDSSREEEYTGVWVGEEKICAIGIKLSRWITMHGLALNVNNDLSYFDKIIPCGIFHKGVTSMKNLLGHETDIKELTGKILNNFERVFKISQIEETNPDEIESIFHLSGSYNLKNTL